MNPNLDTEADQYGKLDQDEFEETLTKLENIIQALEASCAEKQKQTHSPSEDNRHKEN